MGSWNHTCALTHLPILAGEEVYVLLLVEQPRPDNLCYTHTFWRPIPFYFTGKYNDYGAVEDCEGPLLPVILKYVKDHLIEMELGENPYHDIAVKKQDFDIDLLFEADHENRLFVKARDFLRGCGIQQQRVRHVVIRKNVFESLLQQYQQSEYVGEPGIDYVDITLATILKDGDAFIERAAKHHTTNTDRVNVFQELVAENKDADDTIAAVIEYRKIMLHNNIHSTSLFEYAEHNKFQYAFRMYNMTDFLSATDVFVEYLDDPIMLQHIKLQLAQLYWLSHFMSDCRQMWCPASGAGGQSTETSAQELLANITLTEASLFQKRFDE